MVVVVVMMMMMMMMMMMFEGVLLFVTDVSTFDRLGKFNIQYKNVSRHYTSIKCGLP